MMPTSFRGVNSSILYLLIGTNFILCCCGFGGQMYHPTRTDRSSGRKRPIISVMASDTDGILDSCTTTDHTAMKKFLIHWRGEKDLGYSKPFRHLEFENALAAEIDSIRISQKIEVLDLPNVQFQNALNYTGNETMTDMNIEHFNEAMQFVSFSQVGSISSDLLKDTVVRAIERCSLVHAFYEVVASSTTLDDLAELAIKDGGFSDLYKGGANEKATWCFRARMYSASEVMENSVIKGRGKRYSSRTRSMKIERDGLQALKDLLIRFGGKVNLEDPDCKVYIFDGLEDEIGGIRVARKILARRIASGPKIFSIAPAERICITNTPLEPIAAYVLCNIARIKENDKILDPYAGSCTTLLAAAMIAPDCETVGIEIAHNGLVNRDHIVQDFITRSLKVPNQIICGDSTDIVVRETAKTAINDESFDVIIADPPYGIRESVNYNEHSPLEELFGSIATDKNAADSQRLIRRGGRLVAFVPVTDEQTLEDMLPNQDLTEKAGLEFEVSREQPLNDKLSRWLVCYNCIR